VLHVVERFTRIDQNTIDYKVTIDDPKYYTRPWTVTTNARLMLGTELFEFICNENEKSRPHMIKSGTK